MNLLQNLSYLADFLIKLPIDHKREVKVSKEKLSFAEAFTVQRRETDLDRLLGMIRWQRLRYRLEKIVSRSKEGRPAYDALKMFKALLLQRLYDLSDRQIEECLYDRFSFRRFCGFGLDEALPDATTLLRFRQALGGKTQSLLDLVNEELRSMGVQMGQGAIVDATIIRSSAKTPKAPEVSDVDPEAGWTKKNGDYIHGYKSHTCVEEVNGLVQATVATSADVHDSQVFGALLTGEETAVYGDKAYGSAANRQRLVQTGTKDCLLYKASKKQPLTSWQRWLNKLYGPIRQTIERTFSHWKGVLGLCRARYRGWAKNQVHFDLLAMAYNLRRSLKLIPSG